MLLNGAVLLFKTLDIFSQRPQQPFHCCGDITTLLLTLALGMPGMTWMKSITNSAGLCVMTAKLAYTPVAFSSGSSMLSLPFFS